MLKKLTLCASLFMAACGGSGSDGGSGGDGIPAAENFVEGSFKDSRVAGVAYPNSAAGRAVGLYGRACMDEHHYFETADGRIRVYGSTAFSETDFQVVATMVSNRLDNALAQFGLTWEEFVAQRELVNLGMLPTVLQAYSDYLASHGEFDPGNNDPTQTTGSTAEDIYAMEKDQWADWNALDRDEQIAFIRDTFLDSGYAYAPEHDTVAEKDVVLAADKVQICLSSDMGGSQFGEGSQVGIQVPPNTSSYHSRVGEIFTHELVHFIQGNIANVGQNPYALMPRWFTEGQAVYMSGQYLASVDHHHNMDPVKVLSYAQESDSGVDTATAYEHYGLAYQYIHENNGRDTIVQMMQSMKTNTDAPQVFMSAYEAFDPDQLYDEGLAFTRAFDANFKDHTGESMSIEQYRMSYHDYMNAWK